MLFGRVSRLLFDIVGTFVVLLLLGVGILSWRLSLGPLSLDFLTPVIARALSDENASVTVKSTVLAWGGWHHNVDIRIRDVRTLARDGRPLLEVPEVSVGLSARALLLHGLIAPTSLEAIGAQVVLVRAADGTWRFRGPDTGGEAPSALPFIFGDLLAPPNPGSSLGYLSSASLIETAITILDEGSGRTFAAHDARLEVQRDEDGLRAELAAVLDLAGKTATVSADGHYHSGSATLDLTGQFTKLDPTAVAAAMPEFGALAGFAVPLSGRIDLEFDPQFRLAQASFNVRGENGRLAASSYGLPGDATVRRLRLKGRMPKGATALEISDAELDLGGPTVSLRGGVTDIDTHPHAAATVVVRNVSADDLRRLWPLNVAAHARLWITENIVRATIGETHLEVSATAAALDSHWEVEQANGTFSVTDAEVNYITPMPHLQGISGEGKFTKGRVDITTAGGAVGDLHLDAASVALTALDTDDETGEIDVPVNGPLRDALDLIDGPPYGYLKKIGLKPADFSGDMALRMKLKLPLKHDVTTDEIDVLATAQVQHLGQVNAALGQNVADGDVRLRVDKDGLDMTGRVMLGPIPADVELRRSFLSGAPIVGRTKAHARIATGAQFAALGVDTSPYVDGPTDVAVDYVERQGGRSDVTVDATLDAAAVSVNQLDWHKAAGQAASAHAVVDLAGGRVTGVRDFSVTSGDPASGGLIARGKAAFAADGKTFTRVDLDTLKTQFTDIHGVVTRSDAGLAVAIVGPSFDVGPFLKGDSTPAGASRPPLGLDVQVGRLYFAPDRWLGHVRFVGERGPDRWLTANLAADTGDPSNAKDSVMLALQRFDDGHQTLDMVAEDAGAFMRDTGVTPNVVGGRLEIHGATDRTRAGRPVVGHLHMSEYRVVGAPILAKVLVVALLTGVVDSLSGEGIGFKQLDTDFAYFGRRIEVANAHSAGAAIGVTARGAMDIDAETIDLRGTIVPANALNGLAGKIPVIGNLLTGGGGGLFAATYKISGPISDAKVSVNPLSALAPGFLRNLFGSLPGTSPTDATPQSEKDIEQQQPKPVDPATTPP